MWIIGSAVIAIAVLTGSYWVACLGNFVVVIGAHTHGKYEGRSNG